MIISATNIMQQQQTNSNNGTPFIKRKCLQDNTTSLASSTWRNHSPYYASSTLIASNATTLSIYQNQQQQQQISPFNVNNECILPINYSPRHLNESFETLQINNNENQKPLSATIANDFNNEFKLQKKTSSNSRSSRRIPLSKVKSAPIQMLDFDKMEHQPLGDISNTTNNFCLTNNELEDLFFGQQQQQQQPVVNLDEKLIKEALDADASGQNLIGDRSKSHILPFTRSIKHQDLFCITPETLVRILDGKYDESIDKVIIIDSRYPYEYDGGHITTARNIFAKEKLLDELFVHRIDTTNNKNENYIDSAYKSTNKRVIIIFHCEFSSERGPSL